MLNITDSRVHKRCAGISRREMLRIGAEILIERYERGELDIKSLVSTLHVWHTTESELRQKVSRIYDTAYAEKCFDTLSRKEEK